MTVAVMQDADTATMRYMRIAAQLAMRGHGGAEPNPMVGCVIVSPTGEIVGEGYHRQCGDAHAEVIALRNAGPLARGSAAYITLEPCSHIGRTPPCTEALIDAGVARVVIARRDPHPEAGGGIERLRAAGIEVEVDDTSREAVEVSHPFVHRIETGLPWVIAKWAQTLDGRIATRTGDSKWISGVASRRMVHRERGRVDAILTGIGTVLADDPLLTARDVRVRRVARRIVIDPRGRTPLDSQLVRTASVAPVAIVCGEDVVQESRISAMRSAGVEVFALPQQGDGGFVMGEVLRALAARYELSNILVEAGRGIMSSLMQERLINDAWVFIANKMLGDGAAMNPLANLSDAGVDRIGDALPLELRDVRRRGDDVMLRYRMEQGQRHEGT